MSTVFKREFKSLLSTPMGYVYLLSATLLSGILFVLFNLVYLYPTLVYVAEEMKLIYALLVPMIGATVISSEYKKGSYKLLYSLPFKSSDIVLGKFFAVLSFSLLPTLLIAIYPLMLSLVGKIELLSSYAAIVGLVVFQVYASAFCVVLSCVSRKSGICVTVAYAAFCALFLIDLFSALMPSESLIFGFATTISPFSLGGYTMYGIFDIVSLLYALIASAVMIIIAVRTVENRRYM